MQQTRRHILEILKERKEATIDEIVTSLSERIGKITAVTVRHHLEILRGDGLVASPAVRRRSAPGRPQYVYALTERASDFFPNNYQGLAVELLGQMKTHLPPAQMSEILQGVASAMADDAMIPDAPLDIRLDHAVAFMNQNGYSAVWRSDNGERILVVTNCPYDQVACSNPELCKMDESLIHKLVGVRPKRLGWQQEGDEACMFLIKKQK